MNALDTTISDHWTSHHRLDMQQAKLFAISHPLRHPGTLHMGRCLLHSLASYFPAKRRSGTVNECLFANPVGKFGD